MRNIINKYAGIPFSYGTDCCQFVGECVEYFTGRNPASEFKYNGERGANELIASYGTLKDLICSVYGEPYDKAKDGDIALCERTDGYQLAAVVFNGVLVVRTPSGVMDWPLERARYVWNT